MGLAWDHIDDVIRKVRRGAREGHGTTLTKLECEALYFYGGSAS